MEFNTQEMKERVARAEEELMPDARLEKFKTFKSNAETFVKGLGEQRKTEAQQIDQEVEKLKPAEAATRDGYFTNMLKDPEKYESESEKTTRHLEASKQVSVLNYLSKTVLSRIAGEANSPETFLDIVKELASHEDKQMRHVLLDNYHEIVRVGNSIDGFAKIDHELKEQYQVAKDSLKSPQQLEYEKALEEAQTNKVRLNTRYMPAEQNVKEFINYMNTKIMKVKNDPEDTW